MKYTHKQIIDFRQAMRERDAVQQSQIPSWVNKTDDAMWEGVISAGTHAFKLIALAIVTVACAVSIWHHVRLDAPERDAVRECLDSGGKVRVFRNAQGKVFSIGCSHPAEWVL